MLLSDRLFELKRLSVQISQLHERIIAAGDRWEAGQLAEQLGMVSHQHAFKQEEMKKAMEDTGLFAFYDQPIQAVQHALAAFSTLVILRWVAEQEGVEKSHAKREKSLPPELDDRMWQTSNLDCLAKNLCDIIPHIKTTGNAGLYAHLIAPIPEIWRKNADNRLDVIKLFHLLINERAEDHKDDFWQPVKLFIEEMWPRLSARNHSEHAEYSTPQHVAELMVRLARPQREERVYDPCFGVGGFLAKAAEYFATEAEPSKIADTDKSIGGLFGCEINQEAAIFGIARILVSGGKNVHLEVCDALYRVQPTEEQQDGYDCILASPPWNARREDSITLGYPVVLQTTDALFLQHIMAHLRPNGRAFVVLPERFLYKSGPDQQLRELLISRYHVEGVISLPQRAFAPWTSIPASIVVFRRGSPTRRVRFLRANFEHLPRAIDRISGSPEKLADLYADLVAGQPLNEEWAWELDMDELKKRQYVLTAVRPGSDKLLELIGQFEREHPSLPFQPLEKLAHVFPGSVSISASNNNSLSASPGKHTVVRATDLQNGVVKKLAPIFGELRVLARQQPKPLMPNDVLVSRSGRIGLFQGKTEVPTYATRNLFVIRANGVTPEYLALILQSPAYQSWFSRSSIGAVFQNLTVSLLRKLPVPVPSQKLQDLVICQTVSQRSDATAILHRLLSGQIENPLWKWLERPTVIRLRDEADSLVDGGTKLLSQFSADMRSLEIALSQSLQEAWFQELAGWYEALQKAAATLTNLHSIPKGTSRLVILELAQQQAERAMTHLPAAVTQFSRHLKSITQSVLFLIQRDAEDILRSIELAFTSDRQSIVAGRPTEIRITLRNASRCALREVQVSPTHDAQVQIFSFLDEGATAEFPVTLIGDEAGAPCSLDIQWEARLLDGKIVSGEFTLAFLVTSEEGAVASSDIGNSPYIVGSPVEREDMFFGRREILERIRIQFGPAHNANVILLEGNRRTGKTSILKQLENKDLLPGWIPVYASFQDVEGDEKHAGISTRSVFRFLAREIGWKLADRGIKTSVPGISLEESKLPFKIAFRRALNQAFQDDPPYETFRMYLEAVLRQLAPRRLLLMLDEFDKLQEGIDSGITSSQIPENFRHLLQHQDGVSAIITGSRRIKRMREEYWSALFGLGYRIPVSRIPSDEARRLVESPVQKRLQFFPQATERLVDLCACQPFLIQSLCHRIFDQAARSGKRTITRDLVERAAREMVEDNEHFRTLWDYAQTWRRRLILSLCHKLAAEADPVSLDLLKAKFDELGIRVVKEKELSDDIQYLKELEFIEYSPEYRGGSYQLVIPLMAKWIDANCDFQETVIRARQETECEL